MSRLVLPFTAPDLSTFARSLGRALKTRHTERPDPPGHSELLNLIAAALGHRNYQSLRVALAATAPVAPGPAVVSLVPPPVAPPVAPQVAPQGLRPGWPRPAATAAGPAAAPGPLSDNARKALGQFDDAGRLVRWPVKYSVQRLVMWVLWTRFEAKRAYTEREVNAVLKNANTFGDHVTLRRELINHRLFTRKSDCSEYRKLAPRADEETRALLRAWRERYTA